jgi:hypothetical protein
VGRQEPIHHAEAAALAVAADFMAAVVAADITVNEIS